MQFAKERDEILQASAEPIDGPGSDDIKLASHHRFVEPIKPRPLVAPLGAADPGIDKLGDDVPPAPLCRFAQNLALVLDRLISGRNAKIERDRLRLHVL